MAVDDVDAVRRDGNDNAGLTAVISPVSLVCVGDEVATGIMAVVVDVVHGKDMRRADVPVWGLPTSPDGSSRFWFMLSL